MAIWRGRGWQPGQKWLLRPAITMRRIGRSERDRLLGAKVLAGGDDIQVERGMEINW